jgi:hypothetical protein
MEEKNHFAVSVQLVGDGGAIDRSPELLCFCVHLEGSMLRSAHAR